MTCPGSLAGGQTPAVRGVVKAGSSRELLDSPWPVWRQVPPVTGLASTSQVTVLERPKVCYKDSETGEDPGDNGHLSKGAE